MAGAKPKAGRVPARKPSPDQPGEAEKPQRDRFIEAALDAGADDETLEKALAKLMPPRVKRP